LLLIAHLSYQVTLNILLRLVVLVTVSVVMGQGGLIIGENDHGVASLIVVSNHVSGVIISALYRLWLIVVG
jgi:hypothetical protein